MKAIDLRKIEDFIENEYVPRILNSALDEQKKYELIGAARYRVYTLKFMKQLTIEFFKILFKDFPFIDIVETESEILLKFKEE